MFDGVKLVNQPSDDAHGGLGSRLNTAIGRFPVLDNQLQLEWLLYHRRVPVVLHQNGLIECHRPSGRGRPTLASASIDNNLLSNGIVASHFVLLIRNAPFQDAFALDIETKEPKTLIIRSVILKFPGETTESGKQKSNREP